MGPHIANVKRCAEELGMTELQLQQFESVINQTTEEVRRREREMAEFVRDAKDRVDAILTPEQLERLQELNETRWREWRSRSIESSIEWLEQKSVADAAARAKVRTILTDYYERQAEVMRGRGRHSPEATGQSRQLEIERNEKLADVLSAEDLKRFVDERLSSRRRGGWDRNRGDRRGEGGRRGDGRRGSRRGPPLGRKSDRDDSVSKAPVTKEVEQEARPERDNR